MTRLGLGLGFSRGGKAFSPLDIDGLKCWIDAADESTISATGSLVDLITDKSGNGNDADSITVARPNTGTRTINGKNALDFNTDWLRIYDDPDFNHNATGFTIISVAQYDTASLSAFQPIAAKAAGNGTREWSLGNLDGTNGLYGNYYEDGTTSEVLDRNTVTDTDPHIFFLRYGGAATDVEFGYDRTIPQVTSIGPQTIFEGSQIITIGVFGTFTAFFDGLFGEFLYFNRNLTDANLDRIGVHLRSKWGAEWAATTSTLILPNSGQSNATNAASATAPFNNDGKNAFLTTAGTYFDNVEFLNNAESGKPVMQAASDGNHWVDSDLTDGPYLTQWKNQMDSYTEGFGTWGNPALAKAAIWIGGEGDTGQDEDDFYDALEYMFTEMQDYTNPDFKIFVVVPGTLVGSSYDNHQRQRNAVLRIIDDLDFVYFGAESFDLALQDTVHFSPASQATLHTRIANRMAAVFGKRSAVGTLGPIITGATYSGSSVVAPFTKDGGSDLSGSEVDQFRIEDDGSPVTINSITIDNVAETITFNLAASIAAASVVNLWCNYGRGANVTQANMVKDANGLPLRSVSELEIREEGVEYFRLNGTTNYVDFGDVDVLDYNAGFKVGFTFSSEQTSGVGVIIGKDAGGVGTPRWIIYVSSGKLTLRCEDGTADIFARAPVGIFDGKLHKVVCTVDNRTATSMTIEVDGVEVTYDRQDDPTSLGTGDLAMGLNNDGALAIGSYPAGDSLYFNGIIKDVFISDLSDVIVWSVDGGSTSAAWEDATGDNDGVLY